MEAPELRQGAVPRQLPARPDPPAAAARRRRRSRRARRSSPRCASSSTSEVDPLQIERDAKIPDEVIEGLKELGALGMKVAEEYGGLGLSQVYYNRALALVGVWHGVARRRCSPPTSRSASPSRCGCSAPRSRSASGCRASPRTDISAFLLTEPDVGSDPARVGDHRRPGRRRLRPQRHQAVGDQRRDRRRRRRDGARCRSPRATAAASPPSSSPTTPRA